MGMKSRHQSKKVSLYHLKSVLNVKAVVAASNQEKALIGAFFVIVQLHRLIVYSTRMAPTCLRTQLCSGPRVSRSAAREQKSVFKY